MTKTIFKVSPLATFFVAALVLAGCDKPAGSAPAPDARPRVLVSNPPTAWLVKQIAGDKVSVQTLAGGGGCGHGFYPTDAALVEAGKAQVWLTVGMEFESAPWAKSLNTSRIRLTATEHGWMSLEKLQAISTTLDAPVAMLAAASALSAGPESSKTVLRIPTQSCREFNASLASRHAKLTTLLAPLKGQAFLADHAAYGHFASDYGLKQLAIEEEGHETSDAHLTDLIAQAKQAQVKVLFLSESCNRQMAETVAKAVGAKVVAADPNEENTPALLERMANELVKAHGKTKD